MCQGIAPTIGAWTDSIRADFTSAVRRTRRSSHPGFAMQQLGDTPALREYATRSLGLDVRAMFAGLTLAIGSRVLHASCPAFQTSEIEVSSPPNVFSKSACTYDCACLVGKPNQSRFE